MEDGSVRKNCLSTSIPGSEAGDVTPRQKIHEVKVDPGVLPQEDAFTFPESPQHTRCDPGLALVQRFSRAFVFGTCRDD
eukprot:4548698-Pyramimonas_sp.AAC.1